MRWYQSIGAIPFYHFWCIISVLVHVREQAVPASRIQVGELVSVPARLDGLRCGAGDQCIASCSEQEDCKRDEFKEVERMPTLL